MGHSRCYSLKGKRAKIQLSTAWWEDFRVLKGGGWRLGGGTCIRGERRVSKMQEFVCMRTVSILGQAVNKFKSDTEKLKD